MALTTIMLQAIKDEILNDPENIGYAGKTNAEIVNLINGSYTIDIIQKKVIPARINTILTGIAFTPNVIALADVVSAKSIS